MKTKKECEQIMKVKGKIVTLSKDLMSEEGCKTAVEETVKEFGSARMINVSQIISLLCESVLIPLA